VCGFERRDEVQLPPSRLCYQQVQRIRSITAATQIGQKKEKSVKNIWRTGLLSASFWQTVYVQKRQV